MFGGRKTRRRGKKAQRGGLQIMLAGGRRKSRATKRGGNSARPNLRHLAVME